MCYAQEQTDYEQLETDTYTHNVLGRWRLRKGSTPFQPPDVKGVTLFLMCNRLTV